MRLLIPVGIGVLALAVTGNAQDSTVKTETKAKADDAKVMAMTGCVRFEPAHRAYSLVGTMAAADEMKIKTRVKTDVDKDDGTVERRTKTTVDDKPVGTSGTKTTYWLVPRDGVDLSTHVGHEVQLLAIEIDPNQGKTDVELKEKTTVDRDDAQDTTARSKTKLEVPPSPYGSFTVVSVTSLPGMCK